MKSARTIHRTAKFAVQNFWRNIWLSIATILVFLLTLVTINMLVTLNVLTNAAIGSVEDQIDVSVYFEAGTSEEIIFGAQEYLQGLSQVELVEYVSAEEALVRFSQKHKNDSDILGALETVETNPFGGSLIVSATDTEDFAFILEALDNPTFSESIQEKDFDDHERIIERISGFTERVRIFAFGMGAVFVFIAMLIVFNAIRVAIYTHREEIGIMKLVGASNSFIRLPFLLEGVLFSFVATILMAAISYPVINVLEPSLSLFFDGQDIGLMAYYLHNWWFVFGLQFIGLSVLSAISASWAMNRYLKV